MQTSEIHVENNSLEGALPRSFVLLSSCGLLPHPQGLSFCADRMFWRPANSPFRNGVPTLVLSHPKRESKNTSNAIESLGS